MEGPLPGAGHLQPMLVLNEVPCPYLPGHWERKVLLILDGQQVEARHDELTRGGFRRSQQYVYRPACRNCDACIPARVQASAFQPNKAQKRTLRRNRDLRAIWRRGYGTEEQYALFNNYLQTRHGDGEMADMNKADFEAMVGGSPVDTRLVEFRDPEEKLLAAVLCDRLADGFSLVYSFFDPAEEKRSLGNFIILWAIEEAQRQGLEHVYLGYWIEKSPKMAYKAAFQPLQILDKRKWRQL